MKKGFFYATLLMLSFSLMSSTCSSSDDDGLNQNNNSVVIGEISATVQTGTWRITSFVDSGSDETGHFNGYDFSFNSNGSLVASNSVNTYTGSWSITDDDDSDDDSNSSDDIDFNIAFSSPADFAELTEDWHIVSRSSTRLELIHVSGGNGGTDTLTFELN